jgi:hypothetical protein
MESLSKAFGYWAVRRTVVDHLSGGTFHFEGKARLDDTAFSERLRLTADGTGMEARRDYRLLDRGRTMEISFMDGRPFIALRATARQSCFHLCGDDEYRGTFIIRDKDNWIETWQVQGPRKRYRSLGVFARISDPHD